MVHGLLALDLGDLLIGGWRKYGALTAAARRTRAAPGSSLIPSTSTTATALSTFARARATARVEAAGPLT
jgi:hypothetical protein